MARNLCMNMDCITTHYWGLLVVFWVQILSKQAVVHWSDDFAYGWGTISPAVPSPLQGNQLLFCADNYICNWTQLVVQSKPIHSYTFLLDMVTCLLTLVVNMQAGKYVTPDVTRALVVVISNASELQGYTVRALYRVFQAWDGQVLVASALQYIISFEDVCSPLGSPLCILQRAWPCLLCRPEHYWGTTLLASKVFMTLCWWFGGFLSSLLNKLKIPTCLNFCFVSLDRKAWDKLPFGALVSTVKCW